MNADEVLKIIRLAFKKMLRTCSAEVRTIFENLAIGKWQLAIGHTRSAARSMSDWDRVGMAWDDLP